MSVVVTNKNGKKVTLFNPNYLNPFGKVKNNLVKTNWIILDFQENQDMKLRR